MRQSDKGNAAPGSAIVIGYGSIGGRHARLLAGLGLRVAVVSRRSVDHALCYSDFAEAVLTERPSYIVVANETDRHHDTLAALSRLASDATVLVEKPLFAHIPVTEIKLPCKVFVAYNLRFHPVIMRLKEVLASENVLSVQAYVGQYLPDWRPGTDYRSAYSARATQGGGALRDLSHELDYLLWMLGGWQRVTALGGKFSSLEISSDDVYALLMQTDRCPVVTVQLNYLDRAARRHIIVNTDRHTVVADLIRGTLQIDQNCETFACGRDDTYLAMHKAVLSGDAGALCALEEGLASLRLIEAAERSSRERVWVCQ